MTTRRHVQRVSVLVTLAVCAQAALAWYPYSDKYNRWQEKRPINMTGWHNSAPKDHLPERIARFKASGLNQFFWIKGIHARHFFQAAYEGGLEWQFGMRGDEEQMKAVLSMPGCSAIVVRDEPATNGLPEAEQAAIYEDLRSKIAWCNENYPDLLVYANLSIASIDVDRYIETCKPDVFSYDHYPLLPDGSTESHYLEWMNNGREAAMRHRLPYWAILQAYSRKVTDGVSYRMPDEADLRFVTFALLAHGGTGLGYFMYYGYSSGAEESGHSMVDDVGVPDVARTPAEQHRYENTVLNPSYYAVRDLAPEVQNLGNALINLRPKDAIGYTGIVPENCKPFAPRKNLKNVELLNLPDETALVSFFDDQAGEEYFMVVNLRHGAGLSKSEAQATARLTFAESVQRVERLNRLTGRIEVLETRPRAAGQRSLDVQLPGGTGDLFKWSNGRPWALRIAP